MSFWEYLILFLAVILGGGIALLLKKNNPRVLRMSLSFSGAYILGIAALHLMPVVFAGEEAFPGLWILVGFFIQLLLDQLSRGVEHGHIHALHGATAAAAMQILIGLSLHSFIEGMPLSSYPHLHGGHMTGGEHHFNHLLAGIILHKAPAAFALVILLLQSHFSRRFILLCLTIFAAMTPAGAFIGQQLAFNETVFRILMAVVVGSFLHISTTILFEADDNNQHHISFRKLAVIAIGFALALLTLLN